MKSGSCGCCRFERTPITPNCDRLGSSSLEGQGDSSSSTSGSAARRISASPSSWQNMLRTFVRFSCRTCSSAVATFVKGMKAQTSSPLRRQSPSLRSNPSMPQSCGFPCRQSKSSFLCYQSPQSTKFWLTKWEMAKLSKICSRTTASPECVRILICRSGMLYSCALQMAACRSWLLLRMASDSCRQAECRVRFRWNVMVVSSFLSSMERTKVKSLRPQVRSEWDSLRLREMEGQTFPGTLQRSGRKSCQTNTPVEVVNWSWLCSRLESMYNMKWEQTLVRRRFDHFSRSVAQSYLVTLNLMNNIFKENEWKQWNYLVELLGYNQSQKQKIILTMIAIQLLPAYPIIISNVMNKLLLCPAAMVKNKWINLSNGDVCNHKVMVMRVVIRGQVALVIGLSHTNEAHLSLLNVQSRKDAVLGLPHLLLSLVELRLRVGAFLQSGDVVLVVGEVGEDGGELGVGLDEGVDVATHDELKFGEQLTQTNQVLLKVVHLILILEPLRTEVQAGEDVVVRADHSDALSPLEVLSLSCVDHLSDFRKLIDLGEGGAVKEHQGVLSGVDSDVVPHLQLGELFKEEI